MCLLFTIHDTQLGLEIFKVLSSIWQERWEQENYTEAAVDYYLWLL